MLISRMRERSRFPLISKQGASSKLLWIVRIIWGGFTMCIVGIDVAKRSHEAIVIDDNSSTVRKAFNFKNDAEGFRKLLSMLDSVSTEPNDFVIGMESTSHYWLALYSNLTKNSYTVHVLIPSSPMRCVICTSARLRQVRGIAL